MDAPSNRQEGHRDDDGTLSGITVIDFTRALAGPLATFLLTGLGARVIKVEDPSGGDLSRGNSPYVGARGLSLERRDETDMSLSLLARCRGKSSIAVDLRQEQGRDVVYDLIRHADVIVENFSAGTTGRLGIDYAHARRVNPRIVYCSITGFGSDDRRGVRAMDAIVQALSGVMMTSGEEGDPPVRVGIPIADGLAPLYAVIGILAALYRRQVLGVGQHVDVSMLGTLTALLAIEDWQAMAQLGQPLRSGPTLPRMALFGVFPCCDGWVALTAPQDKMAHGVFRAMGRPELVIDARFATRDARVMHFEELYAIVAGWTRTTPLDELLTALAAEDVPAAPIRSPTEAVSDPDVVARGETLPVIHPLLGEVDGIRTMGVPIVFSRDTVAFGDAAPQLGENTEDLLTTLLGYSAERISELASLGAVARVPKHADQPADKSAKIGSMHEMPAVPRTSA